MTKQGEGMMGRYSGLITGKTARTPGDLALPPVAPPKKSKYKNIRVTVDGYVFDSKAEAKRYGELKLLEQACVIRSLTVHPWWVILPSLRIPGLPTMRQRRYTADFSYRAQGSAVEIVEEVKGMDATRDAAYRLRRQMFLSQHPEVDFRETH